MTIKTYTVGLITSLALTLGAFGLVYIHLRSHHQLIAHDQLLFAILALAIVQLFVHMRFFLHVGRGRTPRDLVALAFGIAIIVLVVGGSLWIMSNLVHNTAVPFDGSIAPQYETND